MSVVEVPSSTVSMNPVTGDPPSSSGCPHPTPSPRSSGVTDTLVGGPGTVVSLMGMPVAVAGWLDPTSLLAVTSIVYATPLVRPPIITLVSLTVLWSRLPRPSLIETV